MKVKFKEDNSNVLIFGEGKDSFSLVVPPSKNCIDLIDFDNEINNKTNKYHHNFKGYVVITNFTERIVYLRGTEICRTIIKRNNEKDRCHLYGKLLGPFCSANPVCDFTCRHYINFVKWE